MFGNGVEISLIYRQILGPLVLDWAPNHFLLGAQLASGEKRSVCIPAYLQMFDINIRFAKKKIDQYFYLCFVFSKG